MMMMDQRYFLPSSQALHEYGRPIARSVTDGFASFVWSWSVCIDWGQRCVIEIWHCKDVAMVTGKGRWSDSAELRGPFVEQGNMADKRVNIAVLDTCAALVPKVPWEMPWEVFLSLGRHWETILEVITPFSSEVLCLLSHPSISLWLVRKSKFVYHIPPFSISFLVSHLFQTKHELFISQHLKLCSGPHIHHHSHGPPLPNPCRRLWLNGTAQSFHPLSFYNTALLKPTALSYQGSVQAHVKCSLLGSLSSFLFSDLIQWFSMGIFVFPYSHVPWIELGIFIGF